MSNILYFQLFALVTYRSISLYFFSIYLFFILFFSHSQYSVLYQTKSVSSTVIEITNFLHLKMLNLIMLKVLTHFEKIETPKTTKIIIMRIILIIIMVKIIIVKIIIMKIMIEIIIIMIFMKTIIFVQIIKKVIN